MIIRSTEVTRSSTGSTIIDIGVHQDGLVHITQISDKFVRHPSDVLKVGDIVTVWVLAVDVARGRISLTMKKPKEQQN